jgi:hypothetical protein
MTKLTIDLNATSIPVAGIGYPVTWDENELVTTLHSVGVSIDTTGTVPTLDYPSSWTVEDLKAILRTFDITPSFLVR